jgi:acetyl-CoA C-acetyltransferase
MADAFIISALRTPLGRRGGALAAWHPADLLAHLLSVLLTRSGVPPADIDDVIVGCVSQVGAQSFNLARTALLSAGFPESVPGVTIDRQCGSSQQAIHFAAQGVQSGAYDLAIAAGVEVMSVVPMLSSWTDGVAADHGSPLGGQLWQARYGDVEISQFYGAELLAQRFSFDRSVLEAFALQSHTRAAAATDSGAFAAELVPLPTLSEDECLRRGSTLKRLAALPLLREGGKLTAATSSQVSDGAAALLLASAAACQRLHLQPIARVSATALAGSDPVVMLDAIIPATQKLLSRAHFNLSDIDLYEVNEAFASVPLAWLAATEADPSRLNVNGGAIALGHPLGASGARLATTLIHALRARRMRWGLQTMCEAGGLANATLFEAL